MKSSECAFKSLNQNWKTPKEFLKKLEKEFGKMFDPCPNDILSHPKGWSI